jgi:hypothetical protein
MTDFQVMRASVYLYGSVSVVAVVVGGLPPGSVPAVRVTGYGSGRGVRAFF